MTHHSDLSHTDLDIELNVVIAVAVVQHFQTDTILDSVVADKAHVVARVRIGSAQSPLFSEVRYLLVDAVVVSSIDAVQLPVFDSRHHHLVDGHVFAAAHSACTDTGVGPHPQIRRDPYGDFAGCETDVVLDERPPVRPQRVSVKRPQIHDQAAHPVLDFAVQRTGFSVHGLDIAEPRPPRCVAA